MPLERRTRAILRRAEFGFFGVIVRTTVQTPRFWGAPFWSLVCRPVSEFHAVRRAGVCTFFFCVFRPLRTSCEIVGTVTPYMYVICMSLAGARERTRADLRFAIWTPPTEKPPLARSVLGRSAAAVTRSRLGRCAKNGRQGGHSARKTPTANGKRGPPAGSTGCRWSERVGHIGFGGGRRSVSRE